jgi:hypothetical protein
MYASRPAASLIIDVQDLCAVKAVELCRRGRAVSAYILGVEIIADLQIARKLFGDRDFIETVAGRAYNGTDFLFAAFERVEIRNPVVIDNAGKSVIHAVIDVIKNLVVSFCFTDYFRDKRR